MVVWVLVVGLGCVSGLLVRSNQRLERELVASRSALDRTQSAAANPPSLECARRLASAPSASAPSVSASSPDEPPGADATAAEPEPAPLESLGSDIARMNLAGTFGRGDEETPEQYRARVVPIVRAALSGPREQLVSRLHSLEQDAGVTDEQHTQLEGVMRDAYQETLAFADEAIQSGQLSPYQQGWTGILSFGGGLGAIAESAQERIDEVLTPEQRETFASDGFDWAQYLGVQTPWEDLEQVPSPPPQEVAK